MDEIQESSNMLQKLKMKRKPIGDLLKEDCVRLQLLTPKRAEALIAGMSGKRPEDAEDELVAELRNNLHQQVRQMIRKDKGGAWRTPKAQEEVRLDIAATKTLRGLIGLTTEIMREREEWLSKHKRGVISRFFRR